MLVNFCMSGIDSATSSLLVLYTICAASIFICGEWVSCLGIVVSRLGLVLLVL